MERSEEEKCKEFSYYLNSMLEQLSKLFPECQATKALHQLVGSATETESQTQFVHEWRRFTDTPQFREAYAQKNIEEISKCNIPILNLLDFKEKLKNLSDKSRDTLLKFVEKLDDISWRDNLQEEDLPENFLQREYSVLERALPVANTLVAQSGKSEATPLPNAAEIMSQLPPEMTPLINLARDFITKMPPSEIESMFGNIANIGQTVIRNYDGQVPSELGGNYFADILRKTFTQQ